MGLIVMLQNAGAASDLIKWADLCACKSLDGGKKGIHIGKLRCWTITVKFGFAGPETGILHPYPSTHQ